MFRTVFALLGFLLALPLHTQDGIAAGSEDRAAELRQLLRDTPRLSLEPVPLASRLLRAAALGTVSSLAAGRDGVIYILARGDQADPVIAINTEGRVLGSWGKGLFKVPHSVRVDRDGNIWTVDAGSSLVLKFSPAGAKLLEIAVGEVATGKDCLTPVLCGTTDVAFGPDGRLFISDGYGNARILEYTAAGRRVRSWGSKGTGPGQFQIPHGLATDGKTLYVADRTNARIQLFNLDGSYIGEWTHLGRPFALQVTGGALWVAIMTLEAGGRGQVMRAAPWILKVDPGSGKVVGQIEAPGPHSIDATPAGELFASGCCGGSNPSGFFWFRRSR
jgi:DNA-binding beta-propeller fold protein YncE